MVFTHENKKENLSFFGEKNNFISNLNHIDQEKKSLSFENERLSNENSILKRNEIDLKLSKEQYEVKSRKLEERIKELEEYRSLVGKLRMKQLSVKAESEKGEEERLLDNMDIQNVYLGNSHEQEHQAFVYELKKQMEKILEENIKLSAENKKAKKVMKMEDELKTKSTALQELNVENVILKKDLKEKEEKLSKLD